MVERVLKYIPITTALVFFLFSCGGLYLVGFWSTFDVSLLALVEIGEIPKAFLLPFAIGLGVSILEICIFYLGTSAFDNKYLERKVLAIKRRSTIKTLEVALVIVSALILALSFIFSRSMLFWVLASGLFLLIISVRILEIPIIKTQIIPNKVLFALLLLCLMTPIISFCFGKVSALYIYNNDKIKRIKITATANVDKSLAMADSIKFVGFIGDKIVLSTLDNKRIIVLNQSSFDGFELYEPPKPAKRRKSVAPQPVPNDTARISDTTQK